ncbi:MAG: 4'-phosphopantetheinyl transferase family protein [Candidatus Nanopelagicales bacterium]
MSAVCQVPGLVAWRFDAEAVESPREAAAELLSGQICAPAVLRHHDDGRPYLVGDPRTASRSSSRGWLALGLATGRLGIDVEVVRPAPQATELARRWFPKAEQELLARAAADQPDRATALFWHLWTRKEALAKALQLPLPEALELWVAGDEAKSGLSLWTWHLTDRSTDSTAVLSCAANAAPALVRA